MSTTSTDSTDPNDPNHPDHEDYFLTPEGRAERDHADAEQANAEQLSQLVKQGCFVSLHFSRPTLRTKLDWPSLGHPHLKGKVSEPSTRPPNKSYNEFDKLDSRARALLQTYTTGRKGLRFMYFARYNDFIALCQPVLDAYVEHVETFLATYEDSVQTALTEWKTRAGTTYDQLSPEQQDKLGTREEFCKRLVARLRRSWPDADSLRNKFDASMEVHQFAFAGGDTDDFSMIDPTIVADMKARAQASFQSFLDDSLLELRQRAVETVRNMHRVLVKGETITERSIKPLEDFVEQYKQLQVVPDTEFQGRLESLVQLIKNRGGAEGLRESTDTWTEVQGMLDEVAQAGEALVDEATKKRMGPGRRKIQL